jgi:capsular exopolysaccharide synthesis family protein
MPANILKQRSPNRELLGWQQANYFAESFRHVMASFLRSHTAGGGSKVVLVTSPNPSEGKTTITSNLAICLAETGRRVLLIDADFRRPRVHTLFKTSNDLGLSNLLQATPEKRQTEGAKWGVHEASNFPGLSVLPSGPEVSNHSRLLYSDGLSKVVAAFRADYDFVLIDAPPLLQIADARAMDRVSDGVILVLRAGVTDRKSALDAYRCLHEDGAHIFGTVLNDWRPSKKQTQQYYGYVRSEDKGFPPAESGPAEVDTPLSMLSRRS